MRGNTRSRWGFRQPPLSALCRRALMLKKVQVAPPGVSLFTGSFSKPLASVCEVPGTPVKVLFPTSSPFLIFPVQHISGLFSICPYLVGPVEMGLVSSDPTPEGST